MGIGTHGRSKSSDVTRNGSDQSLITRGDVQCGGWVSLGCEILQSVPAQVTVGVSGAGVTSVSNSPSQFAVTKSLSRGSFSLQGHVMTANGVSTDAAVAPFTFVSRNIHVCTVSSSGVVTPTGRGQTIVECHYPRSCNAPYAFAEASGTEYAYATCITTIVQ